VAAHSHRAASETTSPMRQGGRAMRQQARRSRRCERSFVLRSQRAKRSSYSSID
jgi:hypothetical protein